MKILNDKNCAWINDLKPRKINLCELVHREIDNMITYGRIYKMKKLLRIVVLGLLLNFCSKESEQVTLDCDELI